jgi:4-amino-4-deoxy-L-arabinose transferase-like glycosyltransferase
MPFDLNDRRALTALIAISVLLFIVDLGGRDLWDIDEGMHAAIAQTMSLSGDWVTPKFNGEAFLDKPPLFNWLTAIAFRLFGNNEFAARLPAALSALASVLLCYGIGRELYSRRTGLLAGAILATSLEFAAMARTVQYDVPFALFTTLALFAYILAMRERRPTQRYWVLFYLAAGLAVLTKGPLGVVLVGVAVAAHLVATRSARAWLRALNPAGILIFFAITVPWYVLMELANPGYIHYFIIQQHVGNVLGEIGEHVARHPEPVYYYIPVFIVAMLPWSLTLPQSVYSALKYREARVARADILLVAFFAGSLLVLSAATSKLANYLVPVLPVAAVLIGRYWDRLFDARPGTRDLSQIILFGSLFLILVVFTAHTIINQPFTHWDARTGVAHDDFEWFLLGFSTLWLVATVFALLAKQRSSFVSLSLITPFVIGFILWVLGPRVDDYRGAKVIAMMIDERLSADEPIYFYGRLPDSAMFYTNRNAIMLETKESLRQHMTREERVFVLVRTRNGFWDDTPRDDYFVLAIVANKAIISNQADDPGKAASGNAPQDAARFPANQ